MEMEMSPPTAPAVLVDGIPALLREQDRWLCWSYTWNGKKWDKPPLRADGGGNASSTEKKTWSTFDQALSAHRDGRFDGIGFVLGEDEASGRIFSGLDMDDCYRNGEPDPAARYIASFLPSYTEQSPSGSGLKIFTLGRLPQGRRVDHERGVEFYEAGRYFTVTGARCDWAPPLVVDCTDQLETLHARIFPQKHNSPRELSDGDLALSALAGLSLARCSNYTEWLQVGMALKSVDESLLSAWDDWSRSSDKYVPGACEKKWATFRKSGVSLGSLVFWAQEDGWRPPVRSSNGTPFRNGHAPPYIPPNNDQDPNMGDGLTDREGAGPWQLLREQADDPRYWLCAPIWQASPLLAHTHGFVLLTYAQLYSWPKIRQAATKQAGCYVRADNSRNPVWDSCNGGLLARLLLNATLNQAPPDFDRVLRAAEFILDTCEKKAIIPDEDRTYLLRHSYARVEDGSVLFRLSSIFSVAQYEAPFIAYNDLRDAAHRYGTTYQPQVDGARIPRLYRISALQVKDILSAISRPSSRSPPHTPHSDAQSPAQEKNGASP
jgi:hypothetical protein